MGLYNKQWETVIGFLLRPEESEKFFFIYLFKIYVSDLGFSTSGGITTSRNECLNKSMYQGYYTTDVDQWDDYLECQDNSWLDTDLWMESTMLFDDMNGISLTFIYDMNNSIFTTWIANGGNVHPVFYLNNNTLITSGNGTKENPFVLSLERKESITMDVLSVKKLEDIFINDDLSGIVWNIENDSIIKIENGIIKPLQKGTTKIFGNKDGNYYEINVTIIQNIVSNPNTKVGISIIICLLFGGSLIYLVSIKNKRIL